MDDNTKLFLTPDQEDLLTGLSHGRTVTQMANHSILRAHAINTSLWRAKTANNCKTLYQLVALFAVERLGRGK